MWAIRCKLAFLRKSETRETSTPTVLSKRSGGPSPVLVLTSGNTNLSQLAFQTCAQFHNCWLERHLGAHAYTLEAAAKTRCLEWRGQATLLRLLEGLLGSS